MAFQTRHHVICLSDPKQSAIYFDHVMPLSLMIHDLGSLGDHSKQQRSENFIAIMGQLLGEEFSGENDVDNFFVPAFKKWCSYLVTLTKILHDASNTKRVFNKRISEDLAINEINNQERLIILKTLATIVKRYKLEKRPLVLSDLPQALNEFVSRLYVQNISIGENFNTKMVIDIFSALWNVYRIPVILSTALLNPYDPKVEDITLKISNIPLVDTTNAKWDQILEFRKDIESKRKLRNLRLFLFTNYEGKDKSFIEDDLFRRFDEYEQTCKDWGFETTISSISALFDSKNLRATIGFTAGAALFGEPVVAAGTILTGASIEIGKAVIEIAKMKDAFNKFKRNHDLLYIIEAKEKFE